MCGFWKLPFCHHRAIKLTQNCVCFTNSCMNLLLRIPSHANATPRCLNVSTCCSLLPITCRMHCIGFLERHNTTVFLVLIFIPAWSHTRENRSSAYWRPCSEDASSTKSSAKKSGWSCSFQQWHLRQLGSDCLSNSYRPQTAAGYRGHKRPAGYRGHIRPGGHMWPAILFGNFQVINI